MSDLSKLFANVGTVVGEITEANLKEGTGKQSSQPYVYYRATVKAGNSKVIVDVWGTNKKPLLSRETNEKFKVGDLVVAQGAVSEQTAQDGKIYRSIRAWRFDLAPASSERKAVFHACGRLGHVEVIEKEKLAPLHIVRSYNDREGKPVEQEDTIRLSFEPSFLETVYRKVAVGRLIRVRGDIISELQRNRFEEIIGYRQALQVETADLYDEAHEMWLQITADMAVVQPQPVPVGVGAPASDDDVPF